MSEGLVFYALIFLLGVFISSLSQVLLKKAAMRSYGSVLREYLNPLVIGAYAIFFLATLMTIVAYRGVPLSLGPILEATSYLYITFFSVVIFKEKINMRKVAALALIIVGIIVYSISL